MVAWHLQVTIQLHKRLEDEAALVQARMRQDEALARALAAIVVEQVEIEGAGGIGCAAAAGATIVLACLIWC
jgi:hypothetical protein